LKTLSLSPRLFAIPVLSALVFLTGCAGSSPLAGTSWPGVTVVDQDIYLAYHKVYAVDADGKMKWVFPATLANGQAFYAPPAVSDDLIVVTDYVDTVFALSRETGQQVWLFKSDRSRFVGGATLGDKLVYAATVDGKVHALNMNDGTQAWVFPAAGPIWGTPLLDGETLYIASLDRHIYALDAATGQLQWKFPEKPEDAGDPLMGPIVSAPTLHDGVLYFGSFNYHVYALDTATHQILWKYDTTNWVWSSPVYDEASNLLIGADLDGNVFALRPDDRSVAWKYDAAGPVVGAPLLATRDDGTRVVYISVGAEPNLVTLNADDGSVAVPPVGVKATFPIMFLFWENGSSERVVPMFAPPVAADGLLLIGAHEGNAQIYALDSKTLDKKWEFNGTKQEEAAKTASPEASKPEGLFSDPIFLYVLLGASVLMLLVNFLTGRRKGGAK